MNLFEMALDFIYPIKCVNCGKINKDYICKKCLNKINNLIKIRIINFEKSKDKYYNEMLYLFRYEDEIRKLLIRYKFYNEPWIYNFFVNFILKNEKSCGFLKKYDIIIPVPIHKKRKQKRGYNQSEIISRKIARSIENLEYKNNILVKTKNTIAQSMLDKKERKLNSKNAYEIKNENLIKNKKILLLDDIYTTGSTVNECSKMLIEAGAKKIGIIVIAKD